MRTAFTFLMLATISACAPAPAPAPAPDFASDQQTADLDAIRTAKVQTWRQLYREQNADGLRDFLLDGFVVIGADGSVSTKAEEVAWLEANPWSGPDDFEYIVDDVVFQSPDVAMVYGHGRAMRLEDGKPECIETYRSSNLFRRSEGRWRPAFSHLSGVACLSEEEFTKRFAKKDGA